MTFEQCGSTTTVQILRFTRSSAVFDDKNFRSCHVDTKEADVVKRKLVVDYGVLARDEDGQIIGFKLPPGVNVDCIYPYTRLYKQVEENGKQFNCYLVYKRSSEMDTKEMARLIDGAIWEAKELGIDTDTPEERARWNSY